jgi:hypothetical protein
MGKNIKTPFRGFSAFSIFSATFAVNVAAAISRA